MTKPFSRDEFAAKVRLRFKKRIAKLTTDMLDYERTLCETADDLVDLNRACELLNAVSSNFLTKECNKDGITEEYKTLVSSIDALIEKLHSIKKDKK